MNPRYGLIAGAAVAGVVALILAIAPAGWLAGLLDMTDAEATTFLVRRYAASATVALFVATTGIALGATPQRAGLLAVATWFAVQGVVAVWGIVSGTAGGLAWLAVFSDPLIAAWFLALSGKVQTAVHHESHGSPDPPESCPEVR